MISSRFVRYFAIVLTTTLALGCSEPLTAPSAPRTPTASALLSAPTDPKDGLLGDLIEDLTETVEGELFGDGILVAPVKWGDGHTNQERSVSGTIGYWGGSLSIPGSDFTITFPVGALSTRTYITIISDASGYVSYDMQPHGLQFAKPVVVTQRLRNTETSEEKENSSDAKLFGAYFRDEDLLSGVVNGLLSAVEIATSITLLNGDGDAELQVWLLNHFSRWMLASG